MWEQQQPHDFLDLYRYEFALRYDALADRCYVHTTGFAKRQILRYDALGRSDRKDLAGVMETNMNMKRRAGKSAAKRKPPTKAEIRKMVQTLKLWAKMGEQIRKEK
jgi:hypothetical protein